MCVFGAEWEHSAQRTTWKCKESDVERTTLLGGETCCDEEEQEGSNQVDHAACSISFWNFGVSKTTRRNWGYRRG